MLHDGGEEEREDALQSYGALVLEILEQRGMCTADIARRVGVDRSHLRKVRRRERVMAPRLLDDLISALDLDRTRMALAIGVLGRRELYDQPAFPNVCAFAGTVLQSLLELLNEPGRFDRARVFAALPASSCEVLAEQSMRHVEAQFAKLETAMPARVREP